MAVSGGSYSAHQMYHNARNYSSLLLHSRREWVEQNYSSSPYSSMTGLDGGMQSSAKDLYWFWWIMSGYLLGPRILSLLLVLCCSTKAIIFCLRSLSESIHKWMLGISSFSQLKVEKQFQQYPMQMKTRYSLTLLNKILAKLLFLQIKPGGLYMWYFIFFQKHMFESF